MHPSESKENKTVDEQLQQLSHNYANALARMGEIYYRQQKGTVEIENLMKEVDKLQEEAARLQAKKKSEEIKDVKKPELAVVQPE